MTTPTNSLPSQATQPAPPRPAEDRRSLRARWRRYMILGMNVLALAALGAASLIMILDQRASTNWLHQSTAQQARAAVWQTLDNLHNTLAVAGETLSADTATEADLTCLRAALPVLETLGSLSVVDTDGDIVVHIPPGTTPPALPEETEPGEPVLSETDSARPRLVLRILLGDGSGELIAQVDTHTLWHNVIAEPLGAHGYLYLLDGDGHLLAYSPTMETALKLGRTPDDPADLPSLKAARDGSPALKLYNGYKDALVVGRAEPVPGIDGYVMTETPLSDFYPSLLRGIVLWLLALALAFLIGEWLIRQILHTVLTPVETLQEAAHAVAAGDYRYHVRLPANTDRELSDLGQAFNHMTMQLRQSQDQIDSYTHQMEETIDLRARELSRKTLQLEVAADVSTKIATLLDPRTLADEVIELIRSRFSIYHVDVLLVDEASGQITSGRSQGSFIPPDLTMHDITSSVIAWAARRGETVYVPDISQDSRYRPVAELSASQSALAIPLPFEDNVIGVLSLEADHRDAFVKDEIAVFESLANEIAIALHNAQVFTALENANRDLAQATLQMKQANTLKSRFLLTASHKLRVPLDAIINFSETILSGVHGTIPDTMLDRQQQILENGRRLRALIEDMLDLSTIETGRVELDLQWVDLRGLLDEVMNAARALHQTGYADHDLKLRLEMDESLPPVWADLYRLRYILINLMSNGVKFTDSGEVVLSASADADSITIRVQDTGTGIDKDAQRHLFEPFQHQRDNTASEGKGTGLGLPVSHLLALLHGGELLVDSTPEQGSTFTLRLPRHPDDAPPLPEQDA
ncbi:MAG: GAF domain-containing protein [Anaerolineae bacterium]|nr:GAF domain-containing protein [Anaerolineae bacterium]